MPRELIDTGTDKRYVRRDAQGQFKESDDVSRSLRLTFDGRLATRPKRAKETRAIVNAGSRHSAQLSSCMVAAWRKCSLTVLQLPKLPTNWDALRSR